MAGLRIATATYFFRPMINSTKLFIAAMNCLSPKVAHDTVGYYLHCIKNGTITVLI
jgi:hypothetical protein